MFLVPTPLLLLTLNSLSFTTMDDFQNHNFQKPVIQTLKGYPIDVLRVDQVHPLLNGNKYFKLIPYIQQAQQNQIHTLISFGGAFSNHLWAFGQACLASGFQGIAIVRGDELNPNSNSRLSALAQNGIKLNFVSREAYQNSKLEIAQQLGEASGNTFLIIPEGGTSSLIIESCARIAEYIPQSTSHVILSVGSGGTLAGVVYGLHKAKSNAKVIAYGSFSPNHSPEILIENLLKPFGVPREYWSINLDYRYRGFGTTPSEIAEFQQSLLSAQNLPLDTVYNAKSLKALITDLELGNLPADGKYVYINTGGLI